MINTREKIIFLGIILFSFISYSQQFCVTDEYNKKLIKEVPEHYQKIEEQIQNYLKGNKLKSEETVVIPVVFHIVWIDDRQNLSKEVIKDQLEVLNASFNAQNSDTSILTDTLKNWVGNFKIRFELAHIDPNGSVTNGITRTETINPHFSYYGDPVKKSNYGKEPWPTDRYLNIWVCNLIDGFHGYAQFPGGPQETDGVVVDWQTFGNRSYSWTYPISENIACGKVLVHEIGHWLNLYHPWGNNPLGCGNDYIPETGLQEVPVYHYNECLDTLISTCNLVDRVFVKHYMDYSGCDCMVAFTKNQVERGLASLYTYREELISNHQPIPSTSDFSGIVINPTLTTGTFYVSLPENNEEIEILIFDLNGRIISKVDANGENLIIFNIEDKSNGMYFVVVKSLDEYILSRKILKY